MMPRSMARDDGKFRDANITDYVTNESCTSRERERCQERRGESLSNGLLGDCEQDRAFYNPRRSRKGGRSLPELG